MGRYGALAEYFLPPTCLLQLSFKLSNQASRSLLAYLATLPTTNTTREWFWINLIAISLGIPQINFQLYLLAGQLYIFN